MKQMTNLDVPVIGQAKFNTISAGFMRRGKEGHIFFLTSYGDWTLMFVVLADGTVVRTGGDCLPPDEVVDLVHPLALGISELRWASDGVRAEP